MKNARAKAEKYWARSSANAAATGRLVRSRLRRQAAYPSLPWKLYLFVTLLSIAGAAILLDEPLAAFRDRWPPSLLARAEDATDIGLGGWYLIPAAIVLLIVNLIEWGGRPRRQLLILYNWTALAFFTLVAAGLSGIAVNVLKYSIGRLRPHHFEEAGAFAFEPFTMSANAASFPSGHATTVGAMAGVVILLAPSSKPFVIPVAIAIAASRVVVGAHYPSDVVAGLSFGFAASVLAAIVFARLGYIFRQQASGLPLVKPSFRTLL